MKRSLDSRLYSFQKLYRHFAAVSEDACYLLSKLYKCVLAFVRKKVK